MLYQESHGLYLAPYDLPSGEMMKKFLIIILFALLAIPLGVSALVTYSGNQVSINDPVNDDIFVTGNIIEVNAPFPSIIPPEVRLLSTHRLKAM